MALIQSVSALPTLYEYYAGTGINSGLNADNSTFTLNDKSITLYSGAMHYFRVPKQYWRDRLRKMRAAGLNTVETYVPWNLHEPHKGWFDFGQGGSDMEQFLDLRHFFELAKEEDLLAIVRPGPFICSEWEFGGLPSWLLREDNIKVRTSDTKYLKHVTSYFNVLLPILAMLQFTNGGSIIAFQIENEYGSTAHESFVPDKKYLQHLKNLMTSNGVKELLFTSDGSYAGTSGSLPGLLKTVNFAGSPEKEFRALQKFQPGRPVMSMEFWVGWFDHWTEDHHTRSDEDFIDILERIFKYPASVNMYMFHGGTSYGFMNGANIEGGFIDNNGFQPDVTSYDYDSPLSEAGDYTEKYVSLKALISRYNTIPTRLPEAPAMTLKVAYESVPVRQQLTFAQMLAQVPERIFSSKVMPMEKLDINNSSGQSYGYIVYRKENIDIPDNSIIRIGGRPSDTVIILINGYLMTKPLVSADDLNGFGYWRTKDANLTLGSTPFLNATLEIIVENWGRNNFGKLEQFRQFKGLWQDQVYLNDEALSNWEIVPLEFRRQWTESLTGWHTPETPWMPTPGLYKAIFSTATPQDTFVDMGQWTKGIVVVNGFVLGRYCKLGPQQTLYLPAPLLRSGDNEIVVFEHFTSASKITFSNRPINFTPKKKGNVQKKP